MNGNISKSIILILIILLAVIIIALESCTDDKGPQPDDCDLEPVEIENITSTLATCGIEDGTITITASGGSGQYMYSLDGNSFQSGNTFESLIAGQYIVYVKDQKDCLKSDTVIVASSSGMMVSAEPGDPAGCGTSNGSVTVTAVGGEPPYQYRLITGSYQVNATFTGLSAGNITVLAKDANGCEISTNVKVLSGTSFSQEIQTIINTNCAVSGCHDGGSGIPNWSVKENVIMAASQIKQRTGNGTMPPGDLTISDDEIKAIACWVDDGAKDN